MGENLDKILIDDEKSKNAEDAEKEFEKENKAKLQIAMMIFNEVSSKLKEPGYESSLNEAIKHYERVKDEIESGSIEDKLYIFNYLINFYEFLYNYPIKNQ